MEETTLTLSPNELFFLPQDTPATGPAVRVEITPKEGEPFVAFVRAVKYKAGKSDRNFFFSRRSNSPAATLFFLDSDLLSKSLKNSTQRQILAQRLALEVGSRLWSCPSDIQFFLAEDQEQPCGLAMNSLGGGALIFKGQFPSRENHFLIRSGFNAHLFWNSTPEQFGDFCLDLFSDETSQIRFYLRWQKMSASERDAVALRLPFGNWVLMEQIFTLVLQLVTWNFGLQWPHGDGKAQWQFYLTLGHGKENPASLFASRWQKVLFAIFQPTPWREEPICVDRWRSLAHKHDHFVMCSPPTHHEFLEAAVKLREFLAPHLPSDEIEALFRVDNL